MQPAAPVPAGSLFQPAHGAGAARPVKRLLQRVHFRLLRAQGKRFLALLCQALYAPIVRLRIGQSGLCLTQIALRLLAHPARHLQRFPVGGLLRAQGVQHPGAVNAGGGWLPPFRRAVRGGLCGERGIGGLRLFQSGLRLSTTVAQNLRNIFIKLGIEDAAEDQRAFLAVRMENGEKIPLGDHGHLRKLRRVQPQQFLHRRVDRVDAGINGPILADELRLGRARRFASGFEIFRASPHGPPPAAAFKDKSDPGFVRRACEIAAEALGAAAPGSAGGHSVERKGDGVKQRGLASARIPGNQKQAAFTQQGKIHRLQPRIGAKGAHFKPDRPHAVSPPLPQSLAASRGAAAHRAVCRYSASGRRP